MRFTLDGVGHQARAIIERDGESLSPSYTREYPLAVDRAQGSELWDVDGRRYVDFMSGIAVHSVGHRHPHVEAAVRAQIEKYWHVCLSDFYDPLAVDLAETIQATAPMDDETLLYFGNSGAEAVEAAVKLAMYHTGRSRFIAFQGAAPWAPSASPPARAFSAPATSRPCASSTCPSLTATAPC